MFLPSRARRRGFSITEIALAFGVASLVLGGVWVAASTVNRDQQIQKTNNEIMSIVQNVREYYGPRGALLPGSDGGDITNTLADLGLVPSEMVVKNDGKASFVNHSLAASSSGSLHLRAMNASGNVLRMQVQGLSTDKCIKFIMSVPVLTPEYKIVRIGTSGHYATVDTANISNPGTDLPLSNETATSWCRGSNASSNEVDIDFKVRG